MSVPGIAANSLLEGSFYTSLLEDAGETTAPTPGTATSATPSSPNASADTRPMGGGIHPDLATILKALAHGDTSAATSDLSKLKADLKLQEASIAARNGSPDPLNDLVSHMTASLQSGSPGGALSELAKYFVQNGQSTGTLVSMMV